MYAEKRGTTFSLFAGGDEEGTISVAAAAVRLSCAQRISFILILKSKSRNINFSADVDGTKKKERKKQEQKQSISGQTIYHH